MKSLKCIKSLMVILFAAVVVTTSGLSINGVSAETAIAQPAVTATQSNEILPIAVVNNPKVFLNKKITMSAKFDKFSTLGLDYKPAFRASEEYISFLIKRDDTKYDIPLSEMKLFLKRDMAEKFIDLKTNDVIKITGTVFSDALGDAWVDVENITVTEKAPEKDGVK